MKRKRRRTEAQRAADALRTGRPPVSEEVRCSERITIRMTVDERARIEAEARAAGMSFADLLLRPWREKGNQ